MVVADQKWGGLGVVVDQKRRAAADHEYHGGGIRPTNAHRCLLPHCRAWRAGHGSIERRKLSAAAKPRRRSSSGP